MESKSDSGKIRWHRLLGGLFEDLLTPVGISVFAEFSVMSQSPVADILLLKKAHGGWTSEQLKRLPDGIRETRARHVLIEFKYTESVGENTFRQMVGYEYFYRSARHIGGKDVQPFVISSKIPRQSILDTFGYCPAGKSGVYHSNHPLLEKIRLLSLNELSDEFHNAFVKCFASRKKNKRLAFGTLARCGLANFQQQIQWFIEGLWRYWFTEKGDVMKPNEITPESIKEMGQMWGDFVLSNLTPEERLKGLGPEQILKYLQSEYSPEIIEKHLREMKKKR